MNISIIHPAQTGHLWLHNYADVEMLAAATWLNDIDKTPSSINMVEDTDQYCVDVFVPGFQNENFSIDIEHNVIIITACKEQIKYLDGSNILHPSHEYHYNMFKRSFHLPGNVVQNMISAAYNDDVLRLVLPKEIQSEKKEIKIH